MKLVIDSNILVSAYTTEDTSGEHWQNVLDSHQLFISPEILIEVESTLRHTGLNLTDKNIRAILLDILDRCELVRPKAKYDGEIGNEDDRHLADLAKEIAADAIVTHDELLRGMKKIESTQVLSLSQIIGDVASSPD
ncbi:MAG: putative toxin-antitoxin system toxin component, PIN family [Armatimonadota bacterium]|nr:putative toxin-antitoxin system toxin component, PIN family [Armatimonadota bacterium]